MLVPDVVVCLWITVLLQLRAMLCRLERDAGTCELTVLLMVQRETSIVRLTLFLCLFLSLSCIFSSLLTLESGNSLLSAFEDTKPQAAKQAALTHTHTHTLETESHNLFRLVFSSLLIVMQTMKEHSSRWCVPANGQQALTRVTSVPGD